MSAFPGTPEWNKEVTNAAYTPAQLDQMRSMLDDPNVSAEHKNNFLYVLSNAGRLSDGDIDKYAPQVGADAGDVKSGGNVGSNIKNANAALPAAETDKRNADVQKDKGDIKGATNALSQGGFSNSDQMVDEAVKGLKVFDDFYPYYQKAGGQDSGAAPGGASAPGAPPANGPVTTVPSAPAAGGPAAPAAYSHTGVDPASLHAGMDEFRGIDFTAFHADAQMLQTADKAVSDSTDALHSAWANTAEWTGDAKTAAEAANNALVKGAGDLSQALKVAPGDITAAIDGAVEKNVQYFCQKVAGLYGDGTLGTMSVPDVDNALKAKDLLPKYIAQLDDLIKKFDDMPFYEKWAFDISGFFGNWMVAINPILWIAEKVGTALAPINPNTVHPERDKMQKLLDTTNQKLQQFVTDYANKANSVHQQAAVFVSAIDKNYNDMIQNLSKELDPDPFAAAATPPGTDSSTTPSSSSSYNPSSGGGPSGGGGPTGGGGGGTTPSSMPPPTPTPTPSVPTPDPAKTADGMNPVTGKPLETDPSTGQPYPIDPKTGAALKDTGDQPETVKVQKGDNTIAMSEPGKDGKMDVSVDDGSGHAKDYKLDFGDDKTAGAAADGKTDGSVATPAGSAATPGGFGPQGTKDGAPSADGTYKPGPDGKIHIQDGDLKITAERPDGADGPTVVTVDDGKGDPTKYTLDDKDPSDSKADPLTASTGASGATDGTSGAHHTDSGAQDTSSSSQQAAPDTGASGAHAATPDQGSSSTQGSDSGNLDGVSTQPASGSFTAPGGVDFSGDLGTSDGTDSGGGDVPAVAPTDATAPAGADGFMAAAAAPGVGDAAANNPLAAAFNLEPGAHVGAEAAAPGSAQPESELGTAPGGMDPNAGQSAAAAAPGGGMSGMMGGMGGAAGGGGGGDQQRNSSAYRVDGGIFESSGAKGRISGSLDDEGDRSISYDR